MSASKSIKDHSTSRHPPKLNQDGCMKGGVCITTTSCGFLRSMSQQERPKTHALMCPFVHNADTDMLALCGFLKLARQVTLWHVTGLSSVLREEQGLFLEVCPHSPPSMRTFGCCTFRDYGRRAIIVDNIIRCV